MSIRIQSKGVTCRFYNRRRLNTKELTHDERIATLQEVHQVMSSMGHSSNNVNDVYFDIGINQIKDAPDWVKEDWNFAAQIISAQNGGPGIVEIRPQVVAELQAAALQIPKGSRPPEEAIEYNKAPVQVSIVEGGDKSAEPAKKSAKT